MRIIVYTSLFFFFFNDTATTEIYTLSLHDALPICIRGSGDHGLSSRRPKRPPLHLGECISSRGPISRCTPLSVAARSEEHTSELQSQSNLVCRLLLEKKKNRNRQHMCYAVLTYKS